MSKTLEALEKRGSKLNSDELEILAKMGEEAPEIKTVEAPEPKKKSKKKPEPEVSEE